MTEVHKEISKHSNRQHQIVKTFVQLEAAREAYIEEAIQQCLKNEPFSVEKINAVTDEMNMLAKNGIAPTRKRVTVDMVREFVAKKYNQ